MSEIDEQLKRALRRCDPPEGFADRLLARLARTAQPALGLSGRQRRWPALRWTAVAALVASVVTGIGFRLHQQRQQEAEALEAKQQIMLALRITGSKLRLAKQRVRAVEAGTASPENTL